MYLLTISTYWSTHRYCFHAVSVLTVCSSRGTILSGLHLVSSCSWQLCQQQAGSCNNSSESVSISQCYSTMSSKADNVSDSKNFM